MSDEEMDLSKVPEMSLFFQGAPESENFWKGRITVAKAGISLTYDNKTTIQLTPGFFGIQTYLGGLNNDSLEMKINFFAPNPKILEILSSMDVTREHKLIVQAEGYTPDKRLNKSFKFGSKPIITKINEEQMQDFYECLISPVIEIE